jgi:hypothetical protein
MITPSGPSFNLIGPFPYYESLKYKVYQIYTQQTF